MLDTRSTHFTLGLLAGVSIISRPALAEDALEPIQQSDLNALVAKGQTVDAFLFAFEAGQMPPGVSAVIMHRSPMVVAGALL